MPRLVFRLCKHADYQRVYQVGRKNFAKQMSYFFALRTAGEVAAEAGAALAGPPMCGSRIGLTVGKVMGKAVDRNRIKRRMREAVRKNLASLTIPVDVILHPRRSVIDLEFAQLDREVATVFRTIDKLAARQKGSGPTAKV